MPWLAVLGRSLECYIQGFALDLGIFSGGLRAFFFRPPLFSGWLGDRVLFAAS